MSATPEVTPDEAAARLAQGALLLDVREDDEWQAGHAPEAQHLPLGRLATEYDSLPKDRSIVAICRSGARSDRATAALRNAGYDVVNLAGGMRAWAAAGHAVVTEDGAPGQVV
jgi:rhodanese-related sulfurtransferase